MSAFRLRLMCVRIYLYICVCVGKIQQKKVQTPGNRKILAEQKEKQG